MIQLIAGVKGTGKTKKLLEMVGDALKTSNGDVVVIEKGTKLRFDVSYQARLIDTDEYCVTDAESLFGFIAGIVASNSDVTDLFVDGTLKICAGDIPAFEALVHKLHTFLTRHQVNVVFTVSADPSQLSDGVRELVI
ncbi:MAG: hypothetical protein IJR83_06560 [Clostridia bacterium]|nr:hypothetical protein [Clostridia bacterium]